MSHTFTGENRGRKPVVILDVVTSCGCTIPSFSRRPLLPGEKTEIVVRFDPAGRPGAFRKELGVYSSERRKIATLVVQGQVEERPRSLEERYPVEMGALRFSQTLVSFSYLRPGQRQQSAIGYVNATGRPVTLELRPRERSGVMTVDYFGTVEPGAQGEINLSYRIPAAQPRYGTLRDVLEVVVDGHPTGRYLTAHGIGVDAPPAAGAPRALSELSSNTVKFGEVSRGSAPRRERFSIYNKGTAPLVVRAVECDERIGVSLMQGATIPAGGTLEVEITLDPAGQEFGALSAPLVFITNDPVRPMRRVRATAAIGR